ncbi:MAG: hypothetical protein AAF620_14235 [Bacteroidota bacterium]
MNYKAIKGDLKRVDYFKRFQRDKIYRYMKVFGGPGKTINGYQEVLNFLNDDPIIHIERNYEKDPYGLTGTWCNWEASEMISEDEYNKAYQRVTSGVFKIY